MIRAVLVDDQTVVRVGFRVLLEEHGDIAAVGETAGGREVVAVMVRGHPDVVCIGLRMSIGDDLTTTRQTVAPRQGGSPAALVVTTFDLDVDVFGTLEARTDGFILKDCESEELVGAVRRLVAGYGLVDHTVTCRVIAELARRHAPVGSITEIRKLMTRELEIVRLLAVGILNAETATELVVETSTVRPRPTRVLPKIGTRDWVQAVMWAHRNGLAG